MAYTCCNSYCLEPQSLTMLMNWVYKTRMSDGTKLWTRPDVTLAQCGTHNSLEILPEVRFPGMIPKTPVHAILYSMFSAFHRWDNNYNNNDDNNRIFPPQVSLTERMERGFPSTRTIGTKTWLSCPNLKVTLKRTDSWRAWERTTQSSKETCTYTYYLNGCLVFRGKIW